MTKEIIGLHHVTAIANNAQRNLDFYTKILGLRLVKKTVNFDDPGTYHFYFGDETGTPGTILTFFPWEGIGQGTNGTGMATETTYSVAGGSMDFWIDRMKEHKVHFQEPVERFGEIYLPFTDPDGLHLALVIPKNKDNRTGWVKGGIDENNTIKGFHSVTLSLRNANPTIKILTDVLGYDLLQQDGNRYRFATDSIDTAATLDIIEDVNKGRGHNAAGTVHHIAFRVKDEEAQMIVREKIMDAGLMPTPKIDRNYFYSVYFREPGGVLFEVATDNPGFAADEPVEELGTHLMLPPQYESSRNKIEKVLPKLIIS